MGVGLETIKFCGEEGGPIGGRLAPFPSESSGL